MERVNYPLRYALSPAGWKFWDVDSQELQRLISDRVQDPSQQPPRVIFDLDGTLIDSGARTFGILRRWLSDGDEVSTFSPELISRVAMLRLDEIEYGIPETMHKIGIRGVSDEDRRLLSCLNEEWQSHFFTAEALALDTAFAGAVDFVRSLEVRGCSVHYLSGRQGPEVYEATLVQLAKLGFPVARDCLHLKERGSLLHDWEFKAVALARLATGGEILASFENEYVNIAAMVPVAPSAWHVVVDAPHSSRSLAGFPIPQSRVLRLSGFLPLRS